MTNSCILCGADGPFKTLSARVRDSEDHAIVACDDCGFVQILPMPGREEDQEYYDQNKQQADVEKSVDFDLIRQKTRADTVRRADLVEGLIKENSWSGASVLDVGCGYGFYVREMKNRGYVSLGNELSRFRAEMGAKINGVDILRENILNPAGNLPGPFQIVSLFQVLEHIAEPHDFIAGSMNLVAPGGLLLLEVPNYDDHMVHSNLGYRAFYWQRAHVAYYNKVGLERLLVGAAGVAGVDYRFSQRYGIGNFANWYTLGEPQLKKPQYDAVQGYEWLDNFYRNHLLETGTADTLIALVRKEG